MPHSQRRAMAEEQVQQELRTSRQVMSPQTSKQDQRISTMFASPRVSSLGLVTLFTLLSEASGFTLGACIQLS